MLTGAGFWIWKIKDCQGGDPVAIASAAKAAGFTHVLIKVADGPYIFNINPDTKVDLVPAVVKALHACGLQAWGWHYVYGFYPVLEANMSAKRVNELGLDGFVIDAEGEFANSAGASKAAQYLSVLKPLIKVPLAVSSFRFPSLHMDFPWATFLTSVDINMPQVYWEQAHNASDQLTRTLQEFAALKPVKPIIPTGPTYKTGGWAPSVDEINGFIAVAKNNCTAYNFFSWDECERDLPALWSAIAKTSVPPAAPDLTTVSPDRLTQIEDNVASIATSISSLQATMDKVCALLHL